VFFRGHCCYSHPQIPKFKVAFFTCFFRRFHLDSRFILAMGFALNRTCLHKQRLMTPILKIIIFKDRSFFKRIRKESSYA
jgi:hypothetical protein